MFFEDIFVEPHNSFDNGVLLFAVVAGLQDRTTVRVDAPFIGVCAAVHMPELMACVRQDDPLKLRERLRVACERPTLSRITPTSRCSRCL